MLAEAKAQGRARSSRTGEKFKAETIDAGEGRGEGRGASASSPRRRPRSSRKSRARSEQLRNQVADLAVAGAAKILKREVDAKAHADLLAAIRQRAVDGAPWPSSPPSRDPTPKPRSRSRATRKALPAWSEMLRFAAAIVARPARGAGARQSAARRAGQGIAAAVDRRRSLRRRRPQLRARAGRSRPRRRCCRRSRRCSRR